MAQLDSHQPSKIYRGTVDEVFSHRNEIPPGATLELKVFEETRQDEANENGQATRSEAVSQPRQLHGMGAFKGKLGGTESLFQEKQAEIKREERRF